MVHDNPGIHIRVIAGDTFRAERLTRDLRRTLSTVDGLDVGFAIADHPARAEGEKSAGSADLLLSAAVTVPTATAITRVLVTAIREWCARERNRKVEVTGDGSVVITGGVDEQTERIVRVLTQGNRMPAVETDRETS
ncbi:hypothetical protein AB0L57_18415 [Nocardia sp. NPDC052254]|uniref:hypothetical protein n=1 Tax=Nocardia sp. NPDC052254 TaxID=3155681 RepID=UPI0034207BC6